MERIPGIEKVINEVKGTEFEGIENYVEGLFGFEVLQINYAETEGNHLVINAKCFVGNGYLDLNANIYYTIGNIAIGFENKCITKYIATIETNLPDDYGIIPFDKIEELEKLNELIS